MPELVRLYIRSVALGFAISAVFTAGLIWWDVAGIGHLILVGDEMEPLAEALGDTLAIERVADAEGATALLRAIVRPRDAVLVKASNSIGLARLVEAMAGDGA